MGNIFKKPELPAMPAAAPPPVDFSDIAIQNAKLMERRKQMGLTGLRGTWLTGARGDTTQPTTSNKTILGG